MSNWVTISTADVQAFLAAQAVTKLDELGGSSQLATMTPIIVEACRDDIRTGGGSASATAASVPPGAKLHAIYRIIAALLARPGVTGEAGKSMAAAIKASDEYWGRMRSGTQRYLAPSDPESISNDGGASPSTSERTLTHTRDDQDGM